MQKISRLLEAFIRWFVAINWRELVSDLRNKLLTGIIVAVPLVVTIGVIRVVFEFVSSISSPLFLALRVKQPPPGLPFVMTLLLFLGFGFMTANVLGARLFESMEKLLLRVPGISAVYSATKQVIESFKGLKGPTSFQRVAYVEYPAPGCRLLGFVTGQYFDPGLERDVTAVFLPTSPNPLTGFVIVVDSDKVASSSLTLDEATKLIVSAGLVPPRRGMGPIVMPNAGEPPSTGAAAEKHHIEAA
jgi:uncharacterized membrane protein